MPPRRQADGGEQDRQRHGGERGPQHDRLPGDAAFDEASDHERRCQRAEGEEQVQEIERASRVVG